jgi:hypothetical protein
MAVVLVGGLCVLFVGFFIFMSIVSAIVRMFSGGGYNRGGYQGPPPQGWRHGWGMGWGGGYGHHQHHSHHQHHMAHHPKPPGGGMFGFGGGHKPMGGGFKSKSHFGGGGAHKKW